MVSKLQECANPLCKRKFKPRANGRKQKYHDEGCRRQWDSLKNTLGRKILAAVLDDIIPLIQARLEAQLQANDGTGEEERP